jgi:HEAT repeat protein
MGPFNISAHYQRLAPVAAALLAVLCAGTSSSAQPATADPVEALRQVLRGPGLDPAVREQDLQQAARALVTIADLRRALLLREWRDLDPEPQLAAADRAGRAAVTLEFQQAIRDILRTGDTASRLVVLRVLAEMTPTARTPGSRAGLTRDFASDLVQLARQSDTALREAAARTLGEINPDAETAIPAFATLLGSQEDALRQAAADGLLAWVRIASQLATRPDNPTAVEFTRAEFAKSALGLLPLAGAALHDAQANVRRRGVQTIGRTADVFRKLAAGRRLPADAAAGTADDPNQAGRERAELAPVAGALKDQVAALTHALGDNDDRVRLLARRALEDVIGLHLVLLDGASADRGTPFHLTQLPGRKDPLLQGLLATIQALTDGIRDPNVLVRRAAIDVIETLGPDGAPAAEALISALTDCDEFVRWAATRTLVKLAPVEAERAVPALARLLTDSDVDLRLTAAGGLARYGAAAKLAIPDLTEAVRANDHDVRTAAATTLGTLAGPDLKPAISTLAAAVAADPNARVRQAAAETLGRCGPVALEAVGALRQALGDPIEEVRAAAGDALLRVLQPKNR